MKQITYYSPQTSLNFLKIDGQLVVSKSIGKVRAFMEKQLLKYYCDKVRIEAEDKRIFGIIDFNKYEEISGVCSIHSSITKMKSRIKTVKIGSERGVVTVFLTKEFSAYKTKSYQSEKIENGIKYYKTIDEDVMIMNWTDMRTFDDKIYVEEINFFIETNFAMKL